MEDIILKLNQIKEGWFNYITGNPAITELATKRAGICAECPINVKNKCSKKRGGCGCFIPAKVCCKKCKCPKNKW